MQGFFVWTSILMLIMLIVPMSLEACPGCKTLDDPINKGFNWSILFLMAMPFTVFALIGGTVFLHWNGRGMFFIFQRKMNNTLLRLSVIGSRLKKAFIKRKPL